MLSYSSALVLGIIAEKPINPYEIKKLLERISIRKWLPIAVSSLYATIRTLAEAGLIDCETARDGNMPEKKIYTINDAGRKSLRETLLSFLGSTELDNRKTHIAMLMVCHLDKDQAVETILRKLKKLENSEMMLKRVIASFEASPNMPYTGLMAVKHELLAVQAELSAARELLARIGGDLVWHSFLSNVP